MDDLVTEHTDEIYENEMIALLAEIKRDVNSYLEKLESSPMRSMADLITFNYENKMLVSITTLSSINLNANIYINTFNSVD